VLTLPRPALEPRGQSRSRVLSDMVVPCHDRKMGSGTPRQVRHPWVPPAWPCVETPNNASLQMVHHLRFFESVVRLFTTRCSLKRRTRRYALLSALRRFMRRPVVDQGASVDGRYRFPFIVTNVPSSFDRNAAQFLHHVIGLEKTRACIYRRGRGHENCALCEDKTKPCRRKIRSRFSSFFVVLS
jgi:hypothetical protein